VEENEENGWESNAKFVLKELERIGDGLDCLHEGQQEISKHLLGYNAELRLHIRGVQALEKKTDLMEKEVNKNLELIDKRLEVAELPIKWAMATGQIFKWVIGLGGSAGVLYGFARWSGWL
jgi:hypothetical protein